LEILFIASHDPLKIPYFFKASIAYCEHEGVNLHFGPSNGESVIWYNFINRTNGKLNMRRNVFINVLSKAFYNTM